MVPGHRNDRRPLVAQTGTHPLAHPVAVFAVVFYFAALQVGDACTSAYSLGDLSTRGALRAQAGTTQEECTNRKTYVNVRIVGGQDSCTPALMGSYCYDSSESGSAIASAYKSAYGPADATSNHYYRQDGTYSETATKTTGLYAGERPSEEECPDCNLWNPDTQICEINPDCPGSPIVIATGRRVDYLMTSVADGVQFDLDGDGFAEQMAWTPAGAEIAFLAIDRNGDGYISSGKELFGQFTYPGVGNGFTALARMAMDSNGGVRRGSVSSDDPLYARLLLWTDFNHNGFSEQSELRPASELLSDIGLSYSVHNRRDGNGNLYRYRGWVHVRTAPGRNRAMTGEEDAARVRAIYDVFLAKSTR